MAFQEVTFIVGEDGELQQTTEHWSKQSNGTGYAYMTKSGVLIVGRVDFREPTSDRNGGRGMFGDEKLAALVRDRHQIPARGSV